ncbi:cyclin-T1-5-like isoform X2 [Andrographis paniculata]|nr:cyclin-T1-5-like isoform X2 [Andrographis paniculata]XP_051122008.1 cyclin-T1-5-like isoform X2 [Andrographis paniculata]XP_051122009.1 cyclin-T1-5-like isoform X2 [Andrographis paniculata]XP_051122010.1 cyclin-T1-5-like isoform X2 [Andrographis paniculata]XP_051122011.1 cyclin-T1-5-like isoform X2 [Andrographis paniculata]
MFLAGKVEETPRPLKDVILVSYEIIHKKDAAAAQRIKQKDVYEEQKELILVGERIVLGTLGFDLNLQHPYKPLVEAIKKFQVAQNALAQVAWNFVNDGLRTSLCLQFKPHHIAAGAIFLAAKFLKVKLPSDGEKVWWQEFDVTPRQLEEVSNQMLELYEQSKAPPSQASEQEGSAGGNQRPLSKGPSSQDHAPGSSHGGATSKASSLKPASTKPVPDQHTGGPPRSTQTRNYDHGSAAETNSYSNTNHQGENGTITAQNPDQEMVPRSANTRENPNKSNPGIEGRATDDREETSVRFEPRDAELKDHVRHVSYKEGTIGQSPQNPPKKIDKEKLKAAFERRKARGDITRKMDSLDELERQLEDVEVPGETDKTKRGRKQSWPKAVKTENEDGDGRYQGPRGQSSHEPDDFDMVEEGEVKPSDDMDKGYPSPRSNPRKRKSSSPLDRNGVGRFSGQSGRDHKEKFQENDV